MTETETKTGLAVAGMTSLAYESRLPVRTGAKTFSEREALNPVAQTDVDPESELSIGGSQIRGRGAISRQEIAGHNQMNSLLEMRKPVGERHATLVASVW